LPAIALARFAVQGDERVMKDRNAERRAEAAAWREDGHAVYAYFIKTSAYRGGGADPDISTEIEAVESAGWRLDMLSCTPNNTAALIFRAA
jgi:hypothetical protein